MRGDPTTVGDLVKRMRRITGHLSARDRDLVLQAVDAILELSVRLHQFTHPKGDTNGQKEERRQEDARRQDEVLSAPIVEIADTEL